MTVYAVAESVPEGCDYLTAGKRYLIRRQTGDGFFDIESDEGHIIECRWLNSSRLGGADWTRIDEPTPSQTVSQDRAVEAVARALAVCDGITPNDGATYALSSYGPRARAAIAAFSPDLNADSAAVVGRMVAALELGHETLHQCTAVLSATDCATVAKAMLEMRQVLAAFKKSEVGHE